MNLLPLACMLAVMLLLPLEPVPDARPAREDGPAAFLFVYRPQQGKEAAFDEAYRRHLSWHRDAGDPLNWFGWYVATGERVGLFVDGTFGISFRSFDTRVDPKGDGENFEATIGSLAVPLSRLVYRVRPDLSTAQPLETAHPSSALEVTHVVGRPGSAEQLEQALAVLRRSVRKSSASTAFTWYQLLAGGEQPGYVLMIPRDGWGAYGPNPRSGLDLLLRSADPTHRRELQRVLRNHVLRQSTETWMYRPDLSLLSGR